MIGRYTGRNLRLGKRKCLESVTMHACDIAAASGPESERFALKKFWISVMVMDHEEDEKVAGWTLDGRVGAVRLYDSHDHVDNFCKKSQNCDFIFG